MTPFRRGPERCVSRCAALAVLILAPLDRKRLETIDRLSRASIDDHRKSLEGLAK